MTDAPAPVRQRRPRTAYSKTGCHTCKVRRVKCDESKPTCQRCTITSRKCDGYTSDIPQAQQSAAIIHRALTRIAGTAQEKRGFQYFIVNTSRELTGYYSSSFWDYLVLQASAAEPSLRHAVIAIAALHEEFTTKHLGGVSLGHKNAESIFAVKQYMKAISHLRRSLSARKQAPLTALMSCLLFVCFDYLRGNFDSAMLHLQSGLEIFGDLMGQGEEDGDIAEQSIAPLFMRLTAQSILYIDTRNAFDQRQFAKQLMHIRLSGPSDIPETFGSLEEARSALNITTNGLFRVFYICDADQPMNAQLPEAYKTYKTYSAQLLAWDSSFSAFMSLKSHTLTALHIRGAALLKIHHITATIMGRSIPDLTDPRSIAAAANDAAVFARCINDFETVISLSKSLIAAAEQDTLRGNGSLTGGLTFSTDMGVVAPLYYICIKCVDVPLREQAIDLLSRCPRREGMWDSVLCVQMIREFWEMQDMHQAPRQGAVELVLGNDGGWECKWRDGGSMGEGGSSRYGVAGARPCC